MLTKKSRNEISIGVEIVVTWLKSNGFIHVSNKYDDVNSYIEADGKIGRILVKVETFQSPKERVKIPPDEVTTIKSIASTHQRDAWTAAVVLDKKKHLHGSIKWFDLSKY